MRYYDTEVNECMVRQMFFRASSLNYAHALTRVVHSHICSHAFMISTLCVSKNAIEFFPKRRQRCVWILFQVFFVFRLELFPFHIGWVFFRNHVFSVKDVRFCEYNTIFFTMHQNHVTSKTVDEQNGF